MKTIHWDDLGYSAIIEPGEYSADFKVYVISGWSMESASVYMSGNIKWDGCANIQFDEQEKCMLHFCGRKDAMEIGELFNRLYEECSKNIEHADMELLK